MSVSPSNHTATGQWQSFEMRMRRRRAERCVLRAQVALEAGFPEDAREALEEARRLDSSVPDFDTVQAAVAPRVVEQPAARGRGRRIALVAAALTVVAGSATTLRVGPIETPVVVSTQTVIPSTTPGGAVVPSTGATEPDPVAALATEIVRPEIQLAKEPPVAPAKIELPQPELRRAAEPELPPVAEPPAVSATPVPEVTIPETRTDVPGTLTVAAGTPARLALPAPPPPPDERPAVRATLARYESGYSALSVSTVRSVWPTVNARSLGRAFDDLESQRLSLGDCSISVDGPQARAACAGNATWTEKIGGATHSQARNWEFELRRAESGWQIVRVQVR